MSSIRIVVVTISAPSAPAPPMATQPPERQTCPAAQLVPQAPHAVVSVRVSRHAVPQSVSPAPQPEMHVPLTHVGVPAPHATPAFAAAQSPLAPQCAVSNRGSMHAPPQNT